MDNLIFMALKDINIIILLIIIFISLYVLGKAADYLVEEAVILSVMWDVPKVIIGATIISLGTTIPEVTVSTLAAVNGNSAMALGNAIGSIITNNALILGLVIFMGEIVIDKKLIRNQGGFLVFTTLLLSTIGLPFFLKSNQLLISRKAGLFFIILLLFYLYNSINRGKSEGPGERIKGGSNIVQLVKIIFGAFFIIISSKILLPSVEIIAIRAGIPESIIAATLVSFGTSVPELMTSLTAIKKGHGELAVGNIIGANILNVLFVIGASALVSENGLFFPPIYFKLQIPIMILTSVIIYIKGINKDLKFKRKDGIILLGIYFIYITMSYLD